MVVGEPWYRIGVNITGPHQQSEQGNVYVLTVIDHFTKWVEMFPMRNQEAATVAKLLVDRVFCTHGCPIQILTDQSRNFESELFRLQRGVQTSFCREFRTSAYKPRRTEISSVFSQNACHFGLNWYLAIKGTGIATCLQAVNETTGYTPFFLTYGREARIPANLCYMPTPDEHARCSSHAEFADQAQNRLRQAHELTRERFGHSAVRREAWYNLRTRPITHSVGDKV